MNPTEKARHLFTTTAAVVVANAGAEAEWIDEPLQWASLGERTRQPPAIIDPPTVDPSYLEGHRQRG